MESAIRMGTDRRRGTLVNRKAAQAQPEMTLWEFTIEH